MTVPRTRTEFFQDDIFSQTRALKAAFSSDEWLAGATRDPPLESLRPEGMPLLSEAPAVEKKQPSFLSAKVLTRYPHTPPFFLLRFGILVIYSISIR